MNTTECKFMFGGVSIVSLTALEAVALLTHTDGAYFAPIMSLCGAIAGALLGFSIGKKS